MQTDLNMAMRVAETLLGQDSALSEEDIRGAAESAVLALKQMGKDMDVEVLARELQSMYAVFVADATSLEDDRDHIPWLSEKRSSIEWKFWERYRRHLEDTLPPAAVSNLDEVTDDILRKLEDPSREGRWDRRGMVVGQVQSGKTANYTGLICKAADAGYRLIVVLAGSHNSLRSQTQARLDEGFLADAYPPR
jgi:RecG-like helicase